MIDIRLYRKVSRLVISCQHTKKFCTAVKPQEIIEIIGQRHPKDSWTNVTPKILSHLGINLHLQEFHPLSLLRARIVNYMYAKYIGRTGNPIFSVYDRLSPVVTTTQNFDSLLISANHPSRQRSDCYYVNQGSLLRAHTTAHQAELILAGLDAFLVVGDVYRRDEIDATHYPVFHQLDAVRLYSKHEVFRNCTDSSLQLFENGPRNLEKQQTHTIEAAKIMEQHLKFCLEGLAKHLFGNDTEIRWVNTTFPFTHPSWELEVLFKGKWMEVLGCGIMEQQLLSNCGVNDRMGWAFGLGLERLAMCLYSIPDIRLFWSKDSGFLSQFHNATPDSQVTYKTISQYPQCSNNLSFWLPTDQPYSPNDFYELVRCVGGDIVEQVSLIDEFTHPKTSKRSHCYQITYRHMERTLTQKEVNMVHDKISAAAAQSLKVIVR